MYSPIVSILAIIVGSLFSYNTFGKTNMNSATMMAIDTYIGMKVNPFSGMSLPKNTGTMIRITSHSNDGNDESSKRHN